MRTHADLHANKQKNYLGLGLKFGIDGHAPPKYR